MKRGWQETTTSSLSEPAQVGQKRQRGTSESPEISQDDEEFEFEDVESEDNFNPENLDEQDENLEDEN